MSTTDIANGKIRFLKYLVIDSSMQDIITASWGEDSYHVSNIPWPSTRCQFNQ